MTTKTMEILRINLKSLQKESFREQYKTTLKNNNDINKRREFSYLWMKQIM